MARGGSMLSGIAVGRILIRVGVPEKADYEGPLNAIHKSLVAFRELVDRDSRQSIQDNITNAQDSIRKLNDVTAAQTIKGNNFELAQQKRFAQDSARAFAASTDKASQIAKQAMTSGKGPTMRKLFKVDADISKSLKQDVAGLGSEYKRLKKFAENYYKMDDDQRTRMRVNLQHQLEGMVRLNRQLTEDIQLLEAMDAQTKEEIAGKKALLDVKYLELDTLQKETQAVKDLQTWQKRADEATLRGAKNRKEALQAVSAELKEWEESLKKMAQATQDWADEKIANLNNRLENFKGILMESTVALTAFYYKMNEIIDSIMTFQQELQNAQSIFQTSYNTLFTLSDQIVRFGTEFGISYDNAAKGLYQFASAGLSAAESMEVLQHTLKLSMAVQGDHNTLSKLTTQIIYGFGLEMSDAGEITDKLAHSINKSLIEWQDLASSVKFALPFFASAGQSLEMLLGSLEILTGRALEAGIAGRGLRQAVAEFTQHAKDDQAAFRKLGVEILDAEGNMRELTDIAMQFNNAMGENASDMDLMITLMEDLNIRGATAFVHLAQNAEEYTAAVQDLNNATGAAHKMAMVQQMGLEASLQRLKNRFMAAFLFSDETTEAAGQLNTLTLSVQYLMDTLSDLMIEGEGAEAQLTDLGIWIKNVVITGVMELGKSISAVVKVIKEWSEAGLLNISILKLYFIPIYMVIKAVDILGTSAGKMILTLYVLHKTIGITTIAWWLMRGAIIATAATWLLKSGMIAKYHPAFTAAQVNLNNLITASWWRIAGAIGAAVASFMIFYQIGKFIAENIGGIAAALLTLAIAVALVKVAMSGVKAIATAGGIAAGWGTIMAGAGVMGAIGVTTGAFSGYLMPDTADLLGDSGYGELEAYMSQLEERVNASNAESTGATDLYVDNLYTANDDLAERAYSSSYTTSSDGGATLPSTEF